MQEAGLIDGWKRKWWRSPRSCPLTKSGPAQALNASALSGIFLLVLYLSVIAIVVLFIECCVFKRRRKHYIEN